MNINTYFWTTGLMSLQRMFLTRSRKCKSAAIALPSHDVEECQQILPFAAKRSIACTEAISSLLAPSPLLFFVVAPPHSEATYSNYNTETQLPQPRTPPHSAASSVKTPPVVAESLTRMPPPSLSVSPPPPIFDVTPSLPLTHTTKSCEADSPDRLLWGRSHSGVSELEREGRRNIKYWRTGRYKRKVGGIIVGITLTFGRVFFLMLQSL